MSAESLRRAAFLMRERVDAPSPYPFNANMDPDVARAVATLLSMSTDHAAGRGDFCGSCLEQAEAIADAYLNGPK